MSIRVGRIQNGKIPSYEGYKKIMVMTKSSTYGDIGPYCLKNEQGHIMENIWQFSKIYETVPASTQRYSRWDNRIIWEWPEETHMMNNQSNDAYWVWRNAGMNAVDPIRYPVGMAHRKHAVGSLMETENGYVMLDYIEARKEIYVKVYSDLVTKHEKFKKLKKWLDKGINLLLIEIDGPHQESLDYYKEKYNVKDDFIENHTMLATKENLDIMLNDTKFAYGHGFCLANCLLDAPSLK